MLLSPQYKLVQTFRQVPNSLFSRHGWINECLSGVLSSPIEGSGILSHLQATKCCEGSTPHFRKYLMLLTRFYLINRE